MRAEPWVYSEVLTIRSFGDAAVDAFYRDALLKWKVAPEERKGKSVRSVVHGHGD
jgi:hypothetical protein